MNDSSINTRYAKALFKLSVEKKSIDKDYDSIALVFEAFSSIPDLSNALSNPVLETSKKKGIIQSVFKSKVNEQVFTFLMLIINNKRENYIKEICRNYIEQVKKEKGIMSVVLRSANQIEKSQKQKIISLIKNELKSDIDLTEVVDEELIGGFILRIDDMQYDASVRSQLRNFKKNLIEK